MNIFNKFFTVSIFILSSISCIFSMEDPIQPSSTDQTQINDEVIMRNTNLITAINQTNFAEIRQILSTNSISRGDLKKIAQQYRYSQDNILCPNPFTSFEPNIYGILENATLNKHIKINSEEYIFEALKSQLAAINERYIVIINDDSIDDRKKHELFCISQRINSLLASPYINDLEKAYINAIIQFFHEFNKERFKEILEQYENTFEYRI